MNRTVKRLGQLALLAPATAAVLLLGTTTAHAQPDSPVGPDEIVAPTPDPEDPFPQPDPDPEPQVPTGADDFAPGGDGPDPEPDPEPDPDDAGAPDTGVSDRDVQVPTRIDAGAGPAAGSDSADLAWLLGGGLALGGATLLTVRRRPTR